MEPTPTPGAATSPPAAIATTPAPVVQPSPSPSAAQAAIPATPVQVSPSPQTVGAVAVSTIQQWLQTYGVLASNLVIFQEQQVNTDTVAGFTLNDAAGQSCVGIIQSLAGVILTGDVRCYPLGTPVLTGALPFAITATNEYYVASYGAVNPQVAPGGNAVSILFPDSSSQNAILNNNGFILLQPGVVFPAFAVVIDAGGNTVATVPFQ